MTNAANNAGPVMMCVSFFIWLFVFWFVYYCGKYGAA
jgi:hypothetical protein